MHCEGAKKLINFAFAGSDELQSGNKGDSEKPIIDNY